MTQFNKQILEQLIQKYERSSLSKTNSKRKIRIYLPIIKLEPNYFSSANYQEKIRIDQALSILEDQDYIQLKRNREQDIEEVQLNLNRLEESYNFLNRKHPRRKEEQIIEHLQSLPIKTELSLQFREDLIARLEQFESIASYFALDDNSQITDIFLSLEKMQELEEETAERLFSQKLFQNTKRFQEIRAKIVTIIKKYDAELIDSAADDVLSSYNIVKNPGFVYLKGNAIFNINKQRIDLEKLDSEFSLSTKNISKLQFEELKVKRVVTVENLTTFFEVNLKDTLVIYLGGYHNTLRRSLLKMIQKAEPTLEFYHFGDIDAGGINIYEHLRKKTGIQFIPVKMDIETMVQYKEYGQPLTQSDRQRLTKLVGRTKLDEVVQYMLVEDYKLEQEIVELKEEDFK